MLFFYISFIVKHILSSEQKSKLRDMCFDWLNGWTKKFKQHITSLSGKIARTSKSKQPTQ